MERRLPALSSLRGHRPAQEIRCPAVGEAAHVAADLGQDRQSAQLVDAGNRGQELDRDAKGLDGRVDLLIDVADRDVGSVDLLQNAGATGSGDAG